MSQQFHISAVRPPDLDDAAIRRRLGHVYSLILQCGTKETVDQCEAAEVGERSAAGDTVAAELENE